MVGFEIDFAIDFVTGFVEDAIMVFRVSLPIIIVDFFVRGFIINAVTSFEVDLKRASFLFFKKLEICINIKRH